MKLTNQLKNFLAYKFWNHKEFSIKKEEWWKVHNTESDIKDH